MAKLVRRKGKLLRIGGKLVRSDVDLNPAAPCECCGTPPPPPPPGGSWICDQRTGSCAFDATNNTGSATQAICQASCTKATQTWNCVEGFCVGVVGAGGTYLTQAECLANCNLFP